MGDHTDTKGHETLRLRERLVAKLEARRSVRTEAVRAAMLAVPRHRFVPEAALKIAYADDVFVTKRNSDGDPISSASQPAIVAEMLEQLEVEPGHHVLEIGAGTGYNAALLSELVGPTGSVTTVDLDCDTVKRAREALDDAGYGHVRVVKGDGELGCPEHAPYDRVIVTVATWDLPPAWWDQLKEGGRLVAPLQIRDAEQSVAFELSGGVLRSRSIISCGFMPMRGLGSHEGQSVELAAGRILTFHAEAEVPVDGARGALDSRGTTVWTRVCMDPGESSQLSLWLAGAFPGFGRMTAPFGDHGTQRLIQRWANPAVVDGPDFAYGVCRRCPEGDDVEIGVRGHGPGGAELAGRVSDQVRAWGSDCRGGPGLRIEAYRPGTGPAAEAPFVVPKRHSRLAIRRAG